MTGDCEFPTEHVTGLVHLYRCPKGLHGPLSEYPMLFKGPIFSLYNHSFYTCGTLTSFNAGIQKLMSPCFPKLFPEFTLLYYYVTVIQGFLKSAIHPSDAAGLDTAPLAPRFFEGRLESETIEVTIHTSRNGHYIPRRFWQ